MNRGSKVRIFRGFFESSVVRTITGFGWKNGYRIAFLDDALWDYCDNLETVS